MPPPKLACCSASQPRPASLACTRALRPQVMSSLASVETPVPLSKRAVAGSFIFKLPTFVSASASPSRPYERPRVALFRRSAEVRSYPKKYAPISGSVDASDADPLATAWRELSEETGLTSDALRLLRVGKPYSFSDASVGREWLINPFAFALRHDGPGEAAIRLDWEHQDYVWLDPIDVAAADGKEASLDAVPRLLDSLRRVWFELDLGPDASQALDKGLYDLRRDQVSGARELAAKALDIFICVMTRLDTTISTECWWRNLRWAAWHLWKNGRETMGASILHVVLSCLTQIKARLPSTANLPVDFVDSATAALTHVAKQRQDAGIKIQEAFTAFVRSVSSCTDHSAVPPHTKPLRILTLSSSSTVSSCLHHTLTHTNIPLHIHVLESRPLFEGASMAQTIASSARLSSSSSSVSVYTDASAGLAARNADLVLLGADLIDRDANVSNKMGSLPAVLAARYVAPAAAVVVAAEQDKILPFDPPTSVEDNGSAQVSSAWSQDVGSAADAANIHVSNVSFEWFPADLIDHYITEDGITISKDIANVARDAKLLADSFFASL